MPTFYNSTAMTKNEIMASREERYDYAKGGRVSAKAESGFKPLLLNQKRKVLWVDARAKNLEVKLVRQGRNNMPWLKL